MKNLIVTALIGLCAFSSHARPLTDSEKQAVESSVKEHLKDPDSAKFYHGDFPYPDSSYVYCGQVNAKNSYGGYAGKQLFSNFVAVNKNGVIVAPSLDYSRGSGEQLDQEIISVTCASAGYDIPILRKYFKEVNKSRKENGIPALSKTCIKN
ncbi:TPA_asm: hypothetical protein GNB63_001503 [Salmonella enterica subsp. enterica serovar 6,7,14:g,m[p],s:[1,2,7]]|uniref:hypothetical protein n=1 Tax=Salmonella enterica TaxID=28901 RepID=UPI0003EB13C0|nr:hypothetical protein [Salmonella enterica]EBB1131587.1 hypothetical protein [Salmonella enterica]QRP29106.1 hypothetical protein I6K01_21195 [Salmonella enterica]HAE2647544.1 hypothetical protein [Salmonella enterica subsp. enterica serovar 6,7,14:g,m[p],s:[1,2,7]]HAE8475370.1 hypothetical protein [Salmonella enterica subsp. enterica serovar Montevideo]